jgi:hypothetical protein
VLGLLLAVAPAPCIRSCHLASAGMWNIYEKLKV